MFLPTRIPALITILFLAASTATPIAASEICLEYTGRFDTIPWLRTHLMGVEVVGEHYAIVSTYDGLVLVDLDALPPEGTHEHLDVIEHVDVYNSVSRADGYVYVNVRLGGLYVVFFDSAELTLQIVNTIEEPGVYYEKMFVRDDRLYVAAHSFGIRIFDVSNPASPVLIGSLADGFADAFAIAVEDDTAYVADGPGGLKVVDLTDETNPTIIAGDTLGSFAGTAEDVLVADNWIYVAGASAGVYVYDKADVTARAVFNTPICAKGLTLVGEYLVVADIAGVILFVREADGSLAQVGREYALRRSAGGEAFTVRLWHGLAAWGDDRLVAANWDSVDVFELVDSAAEGQPDITPSNQRLRFHPNGETLTVKLDNLGCAPLEITNVYATQPTFQPSTTYVYLEPGESVELAIEYLGGQPGSGLVMIESNDSDENPLPIEVYGQTVYVDAGEPAPGFMLPSWTFNHDSGSFEYGTFSLAEHSGQIVFLYVFGVY